MSVIEDPPSDATTPKVTLIYDSFVTDASFKTGSGLLGTFAILRLFVAEVTEPPAVTASIESS